jgi:hypothetical protein
LLESDGTYARRIAMTPAELAAWGQQWDAQSDNATLMTEDLAAFVTDFLASINNS